jgi:hypothetical protein
VRAVTASSCSMFPCRAAPHALPRIGRPRPSQPGRGLVAPWPLWPQCLLSVTRGPRCPAVTDALLPLTLCPTIATASQLLLAPHCAAAFCLACWLGRAAVPSPSRRICIFPCIPTPVARPCRCGVAPHPSSHMWLAFSTTPGYVRDALALSR